MKALVRLAQGIAFCQFASLLPAATITLGTAVPTVGDGVQNLGFSTNDATNTAVAFVPSDYLAGDNGAALGQTFTTGANAGGYALSAISVRQVSWGTTFWDFTGGTITLQIFQLNSFGINGVGSITPLALETATVGGEPDGVGFSSGTPGSGARWLTVTLSSTVALNPNAIYGFQIMSDGTSSSDGFFMQIDGTATNSYAGGFALGTGKIAGAIDSAAVWGGNDGQPGDRAFVASMTAVPEPSAALFGGLGLLALLRRRR